MTRNSAPRRDPSHGTWWFVVDLGPGVDAKGEWRERRQARRRGFPTRREAQEAFDELRVAARQGTFVAPKRQTVKSFLEDEWLPAARRRVAEGTFDSYERNVRHHIIPSTIGGIQLQALDGADLDRLYAQLETTGHMAHGRPAFGPHGPVHPHDPPRGAARRREVEAGPGQRRGSGHSPVGQGGEGSRDAHMDGTAARGRSSNAPTVTASATRGRSSPPPAAGGGRRSASAGPMWISMRAQRRSVSRPCCSRSRVVSGARCESWPAPRPARRG